MIRLTPLIALSLALLLAGCGRKTHLDTPVSFEQATPFTPEGQSALTIQRDANGKVIPPPTKPRPTPLGKTFILDPLIE